MGSWGTGFLENDSAHDFLDENLCGLVEKAIEEASVYLGGDGCEWVYNEPALAMVEIYMHAGMGWIPFSNELLSIIRTELDRLECWKEDCREERKAKLLRAFEYVEEIYEDEEMYP